jgi:hypothetical protein
VIIASPPGPAGCPPDGRSEQKRRPVRPATARPQRWHAPLRPVAASLTVTTGSPVGLCLGRLSVTSEPFSRLLEVYRRRVPACPHRSRAVHLRVERPPLIAALPRVRGQRHDASPAVRSSRLAMRSCHAAWTASTIRAITCSGESPSRETTVSSKLPGSWSGSRPAHCTGTQRGTGRVAADGPAAACRRAPVKRRRWMFGGSVQESEPMRRDASVRITKRARPGHLQARSSARRPRTRIKPLGGGG